MRKNRSLRLLTIVVALASTSSGRPVAAEDTTICIWASIVQKTRDGKIARPFATEDAVGSRLVGPLTDDPAKLKAYVTVARDCLYIYSNFRSTKGFATKIATDQTGVGLARLSYFLLNGLKPGDPPPERFTEKACRDAFPRMMFLLDERLRDDPKYRRLPLDGASVRIIPTYATANLVARVVDGRFSLEAPGGGSVQLDGLSRSLANDGGRLPEILASLGGRTWVIDTKQLGREEPKFLKQFSSIMEIARYPASVIYTEDPKRTRHLMLSHIDGEQVSVHNDESLLRADLGVIAHRILERLSVAEINEGGQHIQFTVAHFDPKAEPLKRIGDDAVDPESPRFHVVGICNPDQMVAFLEFARAALDAKQLGVLLPTEGVDIPAMTLVALIYKDANLSKESDLYPVHVSPLAIRDQLQIASGLAADKLRACFLGKKTGPEPQDAASFVQLSLASLAQLGPVFYSVDVGKEKLDALFHGRLESKEEEELLRKLTPVFGEPHLKKRLQGAYGGDANDIIEMFEDRAGKIDLRRILKTLKALDRGFRDFIQISCRDAHQTSTRHMA